MLIFTFVVLLSTFCSGERVAHIFLVAGQSNSEGFNSGGFTSEDVSYPNIWQLDCCFGGHMMPAKFCKFALAQDPLHHQCDYLWLHNNTVGYAMSFARAFRKNMHRNDVIIIVPAAILNTGFHDNTWTAYTGTGFTKAVEKVKQAHHLISRYHKEFTPRFSGIIWHQGTADAGNNKNGYVAHISDYLYHDLLPMIAAFRDKSLLPFTYPELPFLSANLLTSWALNPDRPERLGVFFAIAVTGNLVPYAASVTSYGLVGDSAFPSKTGELVSFNAPSQRLLGKRYYAAYNQAKLNRHV